MHPMELLGDVGVGRNLVQLKYEGFRKRTEYTIVAFYQE
jgi:hypothetical protein